MDTDRAASEAGKALAALRWGSTPAEKRERRRADLLEELYRLDRAELAERVQPETED
jgi:hypothetical protein